MDHDMIVHSGGCHCRKVRWRVRVPNSVVAWNCNCSDCSMRANVHFIAPSKMFELQADSEEFLTTYTFGTHTAKHTFCKVCGITSFYIPRSNPDGIAIAFRCVDPGTLSHVEIKQYDGRNWESSYGQTEIASCSKPTKGTIMIETQVQKSDGYQKELPSQNWGTHEQEVIGDGGGDHI